MRESKSITLATADGDAEFTINQLGGIHAGKLLIRLGKLLGKALGPISLAVQGKGNVEEAVSKLTESLDENEFEKLALELVKGGRVAINDGFEDLTRGTLDKLFTGQVLGLYKLVWFALEVNYTDFFGALGALKAATPSK